MYSVVKYTSETHQDGPEVDKYKKADEYYPVQREEKDEEVVWDTLQISIYGVERMRGEWRWDDPLVVGLVNVLVEYGMVQSSVDPVYAVIGGQEEAKKVGKTLAFSLDCRRNMIHTME